MKKIAFLILIFVTLVGVFSCNNFKMENIDIKPIYKEFNEKLEFGIQYYEISNYQDYEPEEPSIFIQKYVSENKKEIKNSKMILFYKKSLFANYSKNIHDSARDNEFGCIENYEKI